MDLGVSVNELASSTNRRPVVRSLVVHCTECMSERCGIKDVGEL